MTWNCVFAHFFSWDLSQIPQTPSTGCLGKACSRRTIIYIYFWRLLTKTYKYCVTFVVILKSYFSDMRYKSRFQLDLSLCIVDINSLTRWLSYQWYWATLFGFQQRDSYKCESRLIKISSIKFNKVFLGLLSFCM